MGFFDPQQVTYSPSLEPPGFDLLRQFLMQTIFQRGINPFGLSPEGMANMGNRPIVSNQPDMSRLQGFGYSAPPAPPSQGQMGRTRMVGPRMDGVKYDGMRDMPARRGGFGGPRPPQFPQLHGSWENPNYDRVDPNTPFVQNYLNNLRNAGGNFNNAWRRGTHPGQVSAPAPGRPGMGMGMPGMGMNDWRRGTHPGQVSAPGGPGGGGMGMPPVMSLGPLDLSQTPRMKTQPGMPAVPAPVLGAMDQFRNHMSGLMRPSPISGIPGRI